MKPINTQPVYGVVLPPYISKRWEGVFVRVFESGNKIILESGALPTSFTKNYIKENSEKLEVVKV